MRVRRPAQGRHPRVGPQPHRPGRRVRLLLRAGQLRPPRRRLRDGDGQLQPRDRLDRLRHQRPPLLRAAHLRGRHNVLDVEAATGSRSGVIVALGGQTPLKLAGQLPRRAGAGHQPRTRSTWPRTASAGTRLCARLGIPQPAGGTATDADRGPGRRRPGSATRCWCGPATCSAGGPWRSSTTTRTCAGPWPSWPGSVRSAGRAACRPSGRCWSTGSSRTPSRSTWTPSATPPARWSSARVMEHVEEAGVHSGDSACVIPPPTCRADDPGGHRGPHPGHRRRARGARPHQRAVRGQGPDARCS